MPQATVATVLPTTAQIAHCVVLTVSLCNRENVPCVRAVQDARTRTNWHGGVLPPRLLAAAAVVCLSVYAYYCRIACAMARVPRETARA